MSEMRDMFKIWHVTVNAIEEAEENENRVSDLFARILSGQEPRELVEYLMVKFPDICVNILQIGSSSDKDSELNYLSKLISRLAEVMECGKLEEVKRLFKDKEKSEKFNDHPLIFDDRGARGFWRTVWCVKKALGIKGGLEEEVLSKN